MKLIFLWIGASLILTSCNAQSDKNNNDFIQTTQRLLRLINKRDSTAIFKLMWSETAIENKKGDIIKNDLTVINEYLDTIQDLKQLHYNVNIINNNPVDYAIVTVPLRQGEESFKVEVFFSHPYLKHTGQIRTFNFEKTPKSYKVKHHLQIGNVGS